MCTVSWVLKCNKINGVCLAHLSYGMSYEHFASSECLMFMGCRCMLFYNSRFTTLSLICVTWKWFMVFWMFQFDWFRSSDRWSRKLAYNIITLLLLHQQQQQNNHQIQRHIQCHIITLIYNRKRTLTNFASSFYSTWLNYAWDLMFF